MNLAKGRIAADIPARVDSPDLDGKLKAEIGDGIGWALDYDEQKNIVAIRYEYDQALGYDQGVLEEFFKGYSLPEHQDDDFQQVEKRQAAERGLEQRVSDIEARVAALEGKGGK